MRARAAWDLYQWAGMGTPSIFCILEGSANISAVFMLFDTPGRQFISEPPTQLWGDTEAGKRGEERVDGSLQI